MDIQNRADNSPLHSAKLVFENISDLLANDVLLQAYQSVSTPIFILGLEGELLFANSSFSTLLADLGQGHLPNKLSDILQQDDKKEFLQRLNSAESFAQKLLLASVDKQKHFYRLNATPLLSRNSSICCFVASLDEKETLSAISDDTDCVSRSEKYIQMFQYLPQPVFIYDNDSTLIDVNLAACSLLGYEQHEIKGMNVEEILCRNFRSDSDKQLAQVRQSKELFFAPHLLTKTGTVVSVHPRSFILPTTKEDLTVTVLQIDEDDSNRKQLINAIIDTEINERKRFAKDLHDGLGPLLSTVKLYVNELKDKKIKVKERDELVTMVTQLVDDAISNARETANNLMPTVIKNYGLVSAVNSFITKINLLNKYEIKFKAIPSDIKLDLTLETSFYRIIKELVNNTIKHANAKKIDIVLSLKNNVLSLSFADDGIGFNMEQVSNSHVSGLGLNNITNRVHLLNGKVDFNTAKGKGLKVDIEIDLDKMFSGKL